MPSRNSNRTGIAARAWPLLGRLARWVGFTGLGLWSTLAVYYSNLPTVWLRTLAAVLYAVALLACLRFLRPWRRARLVFGAAVAGVVAWFVFSPPSNDRAWQPDVAVLPSAEIHGNLVTLRHLRHCDYRSETDYTVRHYDQTFDLDRMTSVDLFVVYWGSPWIAHTMVSFGFADGGYVCISIETRKELGEAYSALQGFFRRYELIYVMGDERDLVGLRARYRGEQVYLYRLHGDLAVARQVFLDYLKEVNRLRTRPEWYNALTANCTTLIRGHARPYVSGARFDWRILLNGRIDQLAYERRTLDQSLPFPELKVRSLINARAQESVHDPEFSNRIRQGLPGL